MTVYTHSADEGAHRSVELTAAFAACVGCLALAARPTVVWAALGVTMAVGLVGAVAPAGRGAAIEKVRPSVWAGATALGIAAFASVRFTAVVPPSPASIRAASIAIIAALSEELFFRRFVYGTLARLGAGVAVAASALAFALVHIPAYGSRVFLLDLAAGFILSWQRWATGSWTSSAASHAAANLMAIL
jgi:membrane protease YdiL (CAAX protease family)